MNKENWYCIGMKILVATGNAHKKIELSQIFNSHEILTPEDIGIVGFDFEETESTFLGNSLGKAQALWELIQDRTDASDYAVLADDSGLAVAALDGAPGIYSARYGSDVFGRMLESPERNSYLLKNMEGLTDRRAFFVCCMSLILDEYRVYTIQEQFDGQIIEEEIGTGGFGYDPIFYLPEYRKTVAQLPADLKNRISHRGKAGLKLATLL